MIRRRLPDLAIVVGLLLLPLLFFAPVTLGNRTLIPADNLYQYQPWASLRAEVGVPGVPHNALLSDLVLQNYQWKVFLRESLDEGTLPLWQPNQFGGAPFLAAGQHSALYPFSLLYYVLPLPRAYGWFTVSQLWLAGWLMYLFARGVGLRRMPGAIAGVAYQFSAFFIVSAVFPMMIAGAAWLPLLLLMIEFVIERRPIWGTRPTTAWWIAIGAGALMMNIFAGHVEITYYTLIIMAYYAAARLGWLWWQTKSAWRRLLQSAGALLAMVALGMGLGAAQFVPLYELGARSFREAASDFDTVRSYALPARHIVKFLVPNAFGSPAQHGYRDVFSGDWVTQDWLRDDGSGRVTDTAFGIKNYVEGGAYMGLLVMALAGIGLFDTLLRWRARRREKDRSGISDPQPPPHVLIFGILGAVSLSFAFGLPTYALIYYVFPNTNQLHTPFRWVWPLAFCMAVLAAFGADALSRTVEYPTRHRAFGRGVKRVGWIMMGAGAAVLAGLALSRVGYEVAEPTITRVYEGLTGAAGVFPNPRAFYSYEFWNVLLFGIILLGSGAVIRVSQCPFRLPSRLGGRPAWEGLAILVIAADLMAAGWDFNPRADPAWLDVKPDTVAWLEARQDAGEVFRYTAYNWGGNPLHANSTWQYGLQDARGYDSLIPKQYAEYMKLIAPQGLLHNRIEPVWQSDVQALASPLLDLLNVRYVVSDGVIETPDALGYAEVYADDALHIYENLDALPRAYTLPYFDLTQDQCGAAPDDFATIVTSPDFQVDSRQVVIEGFEDGGDGCGLVYQWPEKQHEADPQAAAITQYGTLEVMIDAEVERESWLVLTDSYYPGWKAFVRPQGGAESDETQIDITLVNGNFRGVRLEPGVWTIRFRYSPTSFQVGAFGSFLSGMLIIFMLMLWFWRRAYREEEQGDHARRIAKNSLAPIILNLFNRGIDFAFAFIMLRILGPSDAGIYYYAIVVFGWFDILTNFGLNTLLTREVARDRESAGRYLFNTTLLRLGLSVISVPALIVFLAIRQATVEPALETQAITAIVLLYVGLVPNSISTGLTALFYAFEKAEYPAAITTISTIVKVSLGLATLLTGWGVVGLAGGAVATNLVTLGVLGWLARPLVRGILQQRWDGALVRHMLGESWPLMINHLLATVFFKIDIVLMEAINGNSVVGQYSTAYKWLDALNIIPAFLTMALLPIMARQAHEDRVGLKRNYLLAVKLLVITALPVAVMTTFIATTLIRVLGGAEYLPAGGIALQLMIWSIPIGWINSVTNYVIVALDRQRTLTIAFLVGVSFNIVANLLLLPTYSYRAAAVITILSEGALFVSFGWIIRQELGGMGWPRELWRPVVAAIVLLGVVALMWMFAPLIAVLLSPMIYGGMLLALGPFSGDERARLGPLLPGALRRRLSRPASG